MIDDRDELGRHGFAGRVLLKLQPFAQVLAVGQPLEDLFDHGMRQVVEQLDRVVLGEAFRDLRDPCDLGVLHQLHAQVGAYGNQHVNGFPNRFH